MKDSCPVAITSFLSDIYSPETKVLCQEILVLILDCSHLEFLPELQLERPLVVRVKLLGHFLSGICQNTLGEERKGPSPQLTGDSSRITWTHLMVIHFEISFILFLKSTSLCNFFISRFLAVSHSLFLNNLSLDSNFWQGKFYKTQ